LGKEVEKKNSDQGSEGAARKGGQKRGLPGEKKMTLPNESAR